MSNYRGATNASREAAARGNRGDDRYAFRNWPVAFGPGEGGFYLPLKDKEGNYLMRDVKGHVYDRKNYLCTSVLEEGFDHRCVWCHQGEIERNSGQQITGVQEKTFLFLAVWDFNYWVLQSGGAESSDGEGKFRQVWVPRHDDDLPPDDAVEGGVRFFRMGKNARTSWYDYSEQLEDVCTCVQHTNDIKLSKCYATQVLCSECLANGKRTILFDDHALSKMGGDARIRADVLNQLQKCLSVKDGGCWTTEKEKAGAQFMRLPAVEYGCVCHSRNPQMCANPEPLHPFMGPAFVRRVGEDTNTTYVWERKDMPWKDWVHFVPPQEAIDGVANGYDFNRRLSKKSLEEQAKMMRIPNPFTQSRNYTGPRR
jgi:hypothetical protein